MDMRKITDTYFVAPQIDASDMDAAVAAGVTLIISNRPDGEVPPSHQAGAIEAAAQAAGIGFLHLPLTHQTMTAEAMQTQAEAIAASEGNVLAYCASGTRSTVIWALGAAQSGALSVDQIVETAAKGGYDLGNMRQMLGQLAP